MILVSATVLQSLAPALVICRLDYGSGTLAGLMVSQLIPYPSTAVGSEWLCLFDHITDAVAVVSLQLQVPERLVFKVAVQTYRGLHDDAPQQYLRQFTSIADTPFRQRLRSSSSDNLLVSVVKLSTV